MKQVYFSLIAILLVSGCTTPTKVQQMIEANNQKLASEQLKPEFDRIDTQLADASAQTKAMSEQIAALQTALDQEKELSASKTQNLSMALNKAQGDMGLLQEKMKELQGVCSAQQDDIKAVRTMVDTQKEGLLTVFRKQQETLASLVTSLENSSASESPTNSASELTAPAPVE